MCAPGDLPLIPVNRPSPWCFHHRGISRPLATLTQDAETRRISITSTRRLLAFALQKSGHPNRQNRREIMKHWPDPMSPYFEKGEGDIGSGLKSAEWRVWIAAVQKKKTRPPNVWIARRLNMGVPQSVSRHTTRLLRASRRSGGDRIDRITRITE